MKHAGALALNDLADLLDELRQRPRLQERKLGTFYEAGRARLHFHEDPAGLFADFKVGAEWLRFNVTDEAGRRELLQRVDAAYRDASIPRSG